MKKIFLAILGSFFVFLAITTPVSAADCPVVYGGGQIDCAKEQPTAAPSQTNPTASPIPQQPSPTPKQTQTKGGLQVQPVTPVKTTPATGPEALGLIVLLPTVAAGFYLRKKTS